MVLAPIVRGRKGEYGKQLEELRGEGFTRVKVDGELRLLEEEIVLDKKYKHDISVVVDRLVMRPDAAQAAGRLGGDRGRAGRRHRRDRDRAARRRRARGPHLLASASPACTAASRCRSSSRGRSRSTRRTAPARAAPGWARRWRSTRSSWCRTRRCRSARARSCRGRAGATSYYEQITQAIAERYEVDLDAPWEELPEEQQDLFLYGTNGDQLYVSYRNRMGRKRSYMTTFEGIVPNLERRYKETDSDWSREKIEEYMIDAAVPGVQGRAAAAGVARGQGRRAARSTSSRAMSAKRALEWLDGARAVRPGPGDRAADPARDRRAAALPRQRRRRLPVDGPRGGDAVGRRGAADPAGDADRLVAGRRALHPRRAVDRPAPARQRAADRDAGAAARPRQHRAGGRARRGHDARGRPPDRHGAGRRRARRPRRRARARRRRSWRSRSR